MAQHPFETKEGIMIHMSGWPLRHYIYDIYNINNGVGQYVVVVVACQNPDHLTACIFSATGTLHTSLLNIAVSNDVFVYIYVQYVYIHVCVCTCVCGEGGCGGAYAHTHTHTHAHTLFQWSLWKQCTQYNRKRQHISSVVIGATM